MANETIAIAEGVVGTAQSYLYQVVGGIIILLVGLGIGILVKKLLFKILQEVSLNKIMSKVGLTINLEKWMSNIISWVIYLITIVYFLSYLGITSVVLYLVVGAVLMLVILTMLVGLKDIIPNFIGWLSIQKKGRVKEGHKVDIREIYGTIEKVGYLETEIKTESGDILYVPNSLFLKSKYRLKKKE